MKRPLSLLLAACLSSANAGWLPQPSAEIKKEIEDLTRTRAERVRMVTEESRLNALLPTLTANSDEANRLQAELEETRQVIQVLELREQEARAAQPALRKRLAESLATEAALKAIKKDNRRPTKDNLSGVWSSGPNLVGHTAQIEQRGEKITGRGYYWGCIGIFDAFQVSGTYKRDLLSITFTKPSGEQWNHTFRLDKDRRRLHFVGWREHQLVPWNE